MGMPFMSTSISPRGSTPGSTSSDAFLDFLGLDFNTSVLVVTMAASTLIIFITIIISAVIVTKKLKNRIEETMGLNNQGNVVKEFGGKSDPRYVTHEKKVKIPEEPCYPPPNQGLYGKEGEHIYEYSNFISDPRTQPQIPLRDVRQKSVIYENYDV